MEAFHHQGQGTVTYRAYLYATTSHLAISIAVPYTMQTHVNVVQGAAIRLKIDQMYANQH